MASEELERAIKAVHSLRQNSGCDQALQLALTIIDEELQTILGLEAKELEDVQTIDQLKAELGRDRGVTSFAQISFNGKPIPQTWDSQKRRFRLMDAVFPDTQPSVTGTISLDDAAGAPPIEVPQIQWTNDDTAGAIATMTVAPDNMSATFDRVSNGKVNITVTVTDQASDNVQPFTLVGSVEWDPTAPTSGSLTFELTPAPSPAGG